ncbi:MAG TPA: hypothetical protein DD738_06705 [Ruminiclostridium sp.]|jgi:predicted RNase H-like HicB family nuclease|nr:hypothetical protein [Ruminiclostridium sp.]
MNYLVIIEKVGKDYSAYLPDVPGCLAKGRTKEETLKNIKLSFNVHVQVLEEDGIQLPKPKTEAKYISV